MALLTVSSWGFVLAESISEYTVTKPFIATFVPIAHELKIVDFEVVYSQNVSRFTSAQVRILNKGINVATGTVYVELYNAENEIIANGAKDFTDLQIGNSIVVNVALTWVGSNTITDYASGKVTVT
jgi:hypothetical protein